MRYIKANGVSIGFPQSWDEVKFRTYLSLVDPKNDREITMPDGSIVKGKTKLDHIKIVLKEMGVSTDNTKIEGLQLIIQDAVFFDNPPQIDPSPTRLGEYAIPKGINAETFEQFDKMTELIQKVRKTGDLTEATEALAYYSAIYIQGFKEEFDPVKANELAKKFMDYPCTEVLAVGSFFSRRYVSMESGSPMTSLPKNIRLKKRGLDLKKYLKRLVTFLRLTTSRDM